MVLSDMGVTRKSAAVAAAVPAQAGHEHGDDGHDHGPDHTHGSDHKHGHKGSDDHDHGHAHGGIFGERPALIFALLCGLVLGIGFPFEAFDVTRPGVRFIFYLAASGFGGWFT